MAQYENPAHWEGSQPLLEVEVDPTSNPEEPRYRFTQAAQKAQKDKWQRLMNNRKPRKNIPPSLLASSGNRVPYLLYGWPFKKNHMVLYAKNHHLVYPTTDYNRAYFGGVDEFHFDQLTDDDLEDEAKVAPLRPIAAMMVILQLTRATGLNFELGRPFTFEYDSMLVLWSNRTYEEHTSVPIVMANFEKKKALIEALMNEGNTGKKVELRWWWSWDENGVGVFETLE